MIATQETGVDSTLVRDIIEALFQTPLQKKKAVLHTYRTLLQLRKLDRYPVIALRFVEELGKHVLKDASLVPGKVISAVFNCAVLLWTLAPEEAQKTDTYLVQKLSGFAAEGSLESFLKIRFELEGTERPIHTFDDSDAFTDMFIRLQLASTMLIDIDDNVISLRTKGRGITDAILMAAICEYYEAKGLRTELDIDWPNEVMEVLDDESIDMSVYVTNMSAAPCELGQILITINHND